MKIGNIFSKTILCTTLTLSTMLSVAQKESESGFYVNQVQGILNIDGRQIFYTLPQNALSITLKISKCTEVKGPYADYAEKYLNITSGIVKENNTTYKIESVEVDRTSQTDTSLFYAINFSSFDNMPNIQLSDDGTILAYNCKDNIEEPKKPGIHIDIEPETDTYYFYDLGVKPFIEIEELEDENDTLAAKKPKTKEIKVKTTEDNAAEAAAFIRKIRKRRFKLAAGITGEANTADGIAMKAMLEELKSVEDNYIKLFVGNKTQATYTKTISVSPSQLIEADQLTIGYFSKSQGLSQKQDAKRNDSYPITLKTNTLSNTLKVSIKEVETSAKSTSNIKYGIYYRIPGTVSMTIAYNGTTYYSGNMKIAQKGIVVPLPAEYMNNGKHSIVFDAETGAIKSISNCQK